MAFPPVPFQEWFLRQTSTGNAALNAYVARVKADGGVVEAIGCVPLAVWDWVAPVAPTLLLDLYPNAAAAYSLRKLRAAYSGSAVRVRKEVSTVSSETDIGFLADGSLDTVSLLAFASDADSGDVFVVTWYDQSLSNDATQSTAANQPKIVSGGSLVTENGKAAVEFDGVNDVLQSSFSSSQPLTIASIGNIDTARTFDYFVSLNSTFVLGSDGTPEWRLLAGSSLTNGAVNDDQTLLFAVANSTSSILSVNGSSVSGDAGTAAANLISIGARSIGGGELLGSVSEVIIWSLDQSANRTSIETNINTFYSIYP